MSRYHMPLDTMCEFETDAKLENLFCTVHDMSTDVFHCKEMLLPTVHYVLFLSITS